MGRCAICYWFFGLIYKLVDKFLWNSWAFQKCGITKTPDLNGIWDVEIRSEHDDFKSITGAEVTIVQNWTSICISLKSINSRSESRIASIMIEHPGQPLITYEYVNEPNADAPSTMHMHFGFTRLYLSDDRLSLSGDYYTGRDRANCGTIRLTKKK